MREYKVYKSELPWVLAYMYYTESQNNTETIYDTVVEILESSWKNDPIRLIGVRLGDLCNERKTQISIFDEVEEDDDKDSIFQKKIDEINHKFGGGSVIPATMANKISKKRDFKN